MAQHEERVYFVDFNRRELYYTVNGFRTHVTFFSGTNSDGSRASIPQMQAACEAMQAEWDKK